MFNRLPAQRAGTPEKPPRRIGNDGGETGVRLSAKRQSPFARLLIAASDGAYMRNSNARRAAPSNMLHLEEMP